MRPRLKDVVWQRDGQQVRVVYDLRDHFELPDPDGMVEVLLELLREGGRTVPELADAFAQRDLVVPVDDLTAAVDLLDSQGLLEDGARTGRLDGQEWERYFSNLAFFESFASLTRSREDFQQELRDAHVLVLGTGGIGSCVIPHLCGLGVGRLTLLEHDTVEPRNFARQYLFRHRDIGAGKVGLAAQWVRDYDPTIKVEAVAAQVVRTEQLIDLLDRFAPDVVVSSIDTPREVNDWINAGCVDRGVPYVRGGMWVTQGIVWSVEPGISACWTCPALDDRPGADGRPTGERTAIALYLDKTRTNRAIGPVAGLLGALCAFEVLRYLTRFEPPTYAGRPIVIDFAHGCAINQEEWVRNPACAACGTDTTAGSHRREVTHEAGDSSSREHPAHDE